MKIAALLTAAAAATVVSGNSFRDPKTVVQKQKENKRALTETERRLAVSLMSHVFARLCMPISIYTHLIRIQYLCPHACHSSNFYFEFKSPLHSSLVTSL
jgi:hypothetical protein